MARSILRRTKVEPFASPNEYVARIEEDKKNSHAGTLTFGNDKTDRWAALPAIMDSRQIAQTVLRITRN